MANKINNKTDMMYLYKNESANAAQQGKINHAVIEFIRNCTAFEADAFRIMVCIADGKLQIDSLTPSESALLNNYLNDGCFKEDTDVRKLEKHRRERARQLMTKVETYVKGSNMADAHYALYDFASNETFATECFMVVLMFSSVFYKFPKGFAILKRRNLL